MKITIESTQQILTVGGSPVPCMGGRIGRRGACVRVRADGRRARCRQPRGVQPRPARARPHQRGGARGRPIVHPRARRHSGRGQLAMGAARDWRLTVGKSDDQKRIEKATAEIHAVMDKYELGGCIAVCSRESSAWETVLPKWSGLQLDPVSRDGSMRLRLNSRTMPHEQIESTVAMIANLRDMFTDYANLWGRMYRHTKQRLEQQGSGVDHVPWKESHGIYPDGRKGD